MGILNSVAEGGLSAVGLGGLFKRSTDPRALSADFPEGLVIQEIIDNKPDPNSKIQLIGSFLPFVPFEFGGKQQIVKDYYPGNAEPVVQVLGPRENNVTINGRLKTKRFKDLSLKEAAENYQESIDAMRRRGNLVLITLGNWKRYAFIEEATFKLKRRVDIDYTITFSILGFSQPKNCKMIEAGDGDLDAPHNQILKDAAAALASARNYPASMPRSLSDFLNDVTGTVASAVNLVTSFVDGALKDIENVAASANRAIGLIRYARAQISQMSRRIGTIQLNTTILSAGISEDSFKTAAQFNNAAHIKKIVADYSSLSLILAQLQARFTRLAQTVPLRRHLIKEGETLQKIAIKYYNNGNLWKNIYDHNKLTSPILVVGSIIEIPKV